MQIVNVDPIVALTIGVAVSLLISLWNSYILYKKGAVGKDDVYMLFKIMGTVLPYIANKAVQNAFNEIMHIIAKRLGFEVDEEVEEKLRKALEELENMSNVAKESEQPKIIRREQHVG